MRRIAQSPGRVCVLLLVSTVTIDVVAALRRAHAGRLAAPAGLEAPEKETL